MIERLLLNMVLFSMILVVKLRFKFVVWVIFNVMGVIVVIVFIEVFIVVVIKVEIINSFGRMRFVGSSVKLRFIVVFMLLVVLVMVVKVLVSR